MTHILMKYRPQANTQLNYVLSRGTETQSLKSQNIYLTKHDPNTINNNNVNKTGKQMQLYELFMPQCMLGRGQMGKPQNPFPV